MFATNTNVVSVIAPLNEYVNELNLQGGYLGAKYVLFLLHRPAGFDGDAVLNVVKQYWYDSYGNIRYVIMLEIVNMMF